MSVSKQQGLAIMVLADIAQSMDVQPDELGPQWREFADSIAELVHTAKKDDRTVIGRFVQAAVSLP